MHLYCQLKVKGWVQLSRVIQDVWMASAHTYRKQHRPRLGHLQSSWHECCSSYFEQYIKYQILFHHISEHCGIGPTSPFLRRGKMWQWWHQVSQKMKVFLRAARWQRSILAASQLSVAQVTPVTFSWGILHIFTADLLLAWKCMVIYKTRHREAQVTECNWVQDKKKGGKGK